MGLVRQRLRPWIIDRLSRLAELERQRAKLLHSVSGSVLEIGFGGGASLAFYGKGAHVTAVEPEAAMCRLAVERRPSWQTPVDLVRARGECLPFRDESFDNAVFTLTLCSVADPAAILAEAGRILRPGGRLYFMEHVISDDERTIGWQRRVNVVYHRLSAGCRLGRDTEAQIREAGFHIAELHPFRLQRSGGRVASLFPFIRGVALKQRPI